MEDVEKLHVYDHCVKIIGWEKDDLVAVNSWSSHWGRLNGTFKLNPSRLPGDRCDMYSAMANLEY